MWLNRKLIADFPQRAIRKTVVLNLKNLTNHLDNSESNKKIVRDYIEKVINTGNTKIVSEYISNDYSEIYNGTIYNVGLKGAVEHIQGVHKTYSELKLKVQNQWCDGQYVITQYVMNGIHVGKWMEIKPTNKPVEIYGVNIDKIVDGKITEHGGSANLLEPLLSIGGISINKD